MNRHELLDVHDEMSSAALHLMQMKNADYAENDDPFGNLNMIEYLSHGKYLAELGIAVRMSDKLSRVFNALERPLEVQDETLYDTLLDVINYAVLLVAKIRSRADETTRRRTALKVAMDAGYKLAKARTPRGTGPMHIYIAGPYTGDGTRKAKDQNTANAVAVQKKLTRMGHYPHCPHVMTDHLDNWAAAGDPEAEHRYFLDMDLSYIRRMMDAVLRLPGASVGADEEVQLAKDLGLPVYESLDEVPELPRGEKEEEEAPEAQTCCSVVD
jgi:hypothetical protein